MAVPPKAQAKAKAPKAKALALAQSALFVLPPVGEALLTIDQTAASYGVLPQTIWDWLKNDPSFTPRPVRKGTRSLDCGSPRFARTWRTCATTTRARAR